jgi:hypothetical protein
MLSKNQVQNGINSSTIIQLKFEEDEAKIRPISSKEWEDAQEMESKAFGKIKTGNLNVDPHASKAKMEQQIMQNMNVDMDLAEMSKAEYDAKVKVVSLGLSVKGEDPWTEEDVHGLLEPTVNELYDAILSISGIPQNASQAKQLKKELESFPEDSERASDSPK